VQDQDASDHCLNHGIACDARALDLQADSRRAGQISSVAYGSGAALLLTGLILQASDPSFRRKGALPGGARVAAGPMRGGALVSVEVPW
jgi:hypothetical protein